MSETIHVFDTAADNPYHFPPRWLNEGLAMYLSDGYPPGDRSAVEAAGRDGRLIPLDGLTGQFPTTFEGFSLAYSESVSAVDYLIRTHGQDAMVDLIGRDDVMTGKSYLAEIIENCRQEVSYVWAEGRTYDQRDLLKAHGFKWNSGTQVWGKFVPSAEAARQIEDVQLLVPGVRVLTRQVGLHERFKPIA